MSDQPKMIADIAALLRSCGAASAAEQLEAQQAALGLAYGLLWLCPVDRATMTGERIYQARQALLGQLDREDKLRGLTAAQDLESHAKFAKH